jgi:hypothetical protein
MVSYPISSFPRAATAISSLLRRIGIEQLEQDSFFLYGACARALLTGEACPTIYLAARPGAVSSVASLLTDRTVLLRDVPAESAAELLQVADFSVDQVVVSGGMVYASQGALEAIAQRVLVCRLDSPLSPAITLLRTFAYVSRGYLLPKSEFGKLLRRVDPSSLSLLSEPTAYSEGKVRHIALSCIDDRASSSHMRGKPRIRIRMQGADAPRYAGTEGFVVREARCFPRMADALDRFDGALGLGHLRCPHFFVFGSFVHSHLGAGSFNDIDIAAASQQDRADLLKALNSGHSMRFLSQPHPVRVDLNSRTFSTPYQILNRTDFTITQAVVEFPSRRVYLSDRYFEHQCSSLLILNPLSGELPLHSLFRLYKYLERGFVCPVSTLETLLSRYSKRPLWRRWIDAQLYLRRDAGHLTISP